MILALLAHLARAEEPLPLPDRRPGRPTEPAPRYGTSGFRLIVPAGGPAASTRLAFVQDFDGASIGELTVRTQAAWRPISVAMELVGTAGASDLWSGIGVGNLSLDVRGLFGRTATHALGLRATLPAGLRSGPRGPVAWWGTVPQATLPTWGLALAYDGATPRWAWHAHVGPRGGYWWQASDGVFGFLDAATSLVTVQPVSERWAVVVEAELLVDPSPLHLRGLARCDLGHGWEVDAGLAVPIVAFFREPTLQLLGRVERRW